jgi:hypothetical protein
MNFILNIAKKIIFVENWIEETRSKQFMLLSFKTNTQNEMFKS